MNRVDEILAIIDTGLQTAGDTAYGDDWPDSCWRCNEQSPTDLCDQCRTELLNDKQPSARDFVTVLIHLDYGAFHAALDQLVATFGQLGPELVRRIVDDHIRIEHINNPSEMSTTP